MYFFYWLPFFPNLANPYTERAFLLLCIYTFMGYFFNFSWITRENESVIKSKSFSLKFFSSCFTSQNLSFSWDFMVPVRILPPYCQKLFLRSRHYYLMVFCKKTIFHMHEKTSSLKKWFLPYGKNHFRVKMYPISQQLTKIFLIESHQENKQVKQKWDTKIQKQ